MLNVQLDQERAEQIYRELATKKIAELQDETVFWDMKELIRQSKMSRTTIDTLFLNDKAKFPDLPKFKSDNKWRFPMKECKAYLENWWLTQPGG